MCVAVSIQGFFCCGIYENIILSQVVHAPEPIRYLSFKSILRDGYKIIWVNSSSVIPPEIEFENVFKLKRLEHLLYFSFQEIKLEMSNLKSKAFYLAQKYMTLCDLI